MIYDETIALQYFEKSKILIPETTPQIDNRSGKQFYRRERYRGVYICEVENIQNLIKIGRSDDIYMRMKQFSFLYKSPARVVVAYETQNHKSVEIFLHRYFEKFRIKGEWFQRNAVLAALGVG